MARQPGTRLAHRLRKHSPRPARGFFMPQIKEADLDEYIAELLAVAPPLTDERRAIIAALLTHTNERPQTVAAA